MRTFAENCGARMLLLVYSATLLAAVLVSDRARRTVLSTAVLFLAVGAVFGMVRGPVSAGSIRSIADLALVAVLFTDAMRASLPQLRRAWRLPGRALLVGLPLALAGSALAAKALVGLTWPEALLVGAALAPTDPVFASAMVGAEQVPARLRHLLNVESGVNDGIALPFVIAFLAWTGNRPFSVLPIARELALGIALGLVVPWVAVKLERSAAFGATEQYRRLGILAVGMVVYTLSEALHANEFLAAFTAGATIATIAPRAPRHFAQIGDATTELLKLAALLVFGSILFRHVVNDVTWGAWAFALVALLVVRPLAIALALAGSPLTRREKVVAAWFGPKGFASVFFGLLIVSSGIPRADLVFQVVALTTALSIVLHSSTDVPVARWFERTPDAPGPRDGSAQRA